MLKTIVYYADNVQAELVDQLLTGWIVWLVGPVLLVLLVGYLVRRRMAGGEY